MRWQRLPLLLAAALLLVGGVARAVAESVSVGGAVLAAGMILLGAWIAVEVRDRDDHGPR